MNIKKINQFLKNKTLLITGATGSLGSSLVDFLIDNKIAIKKIIIFSRDELKQFEMKKKYKTNLKKIRFILGDIRDRNRVFTATRNVDFIIHAAALKQVEAAEYNPMEFINTNIIGTQNIIEASIYNKVSRIVSLSTDKASSPANLYGATKLCADKLVLSSNNVVGNKKPIFCVVRYGNVFNSRGSVVPEFLRQKKENKEIRISDPKMTRFHIELSKAVDSVFYSLVHAYGGEIFIPKLRSYNLLDLANAVDSKLKKRILGKGFGEKTHEEMISEHDIDNLADKDGYFIILTNQLNIDLKSKYKKFIFKPNFRSYNSKDNKKFISVAELSKIIKSYK